MKIAILGYSGSGKSTIAKYLSNLYEIPVLHLDSVQFQPNWVERDKKEAIFMVSEFMKGDNWVIDGNYTSFLQDQRLEQADKIIYLSFSRWSCLYRVLHRYFKNRNKVREDMADGCIEKIDLEFIWWILYSSRTRQKKQYYDKILNRYRYKSIIIKNQNHLDKYMINMAFFQ